ncbi:MAG: DUF309 domain-containing protein [Thermoplasmata archaeon]
MPATLSKEARRTRLHRALREGVNLYNAGRFFETHEVLEDVWLVEEGDDKTFLQGIIKIAAAFHHFRKGTYKGMRSLLQGGREMLEPFLPAHRGLELAHYLAEVEKWIPHADRLLAGETPENPGPIPPLVYQGSDDRHPAEE